MQEFLIYFLVVLAIFFGFYGKTSSNAFSYFVSAIFLFLIGSGILMSGWERFEGGALVQDLNASAQLITPQLVTHNPVMFDPVWSFGIILLILSLGMGAQGYNETKENSAANS